MPIKFKVVKHLNDKGAPTHDPHYQEAHRFANRYEKSHDPKGYEALKQLEHKLKPHELMGKNLNNGTMEVESRFKKYAHEILYNHELPEFIKRKELKR